MSVSDTAQPASLPTFISARFVVTAANAEALLRHRDTLPMAHPDRDSIRTRIIEHNLPMAHRLARRYVGRGEPYDDLAQAAAVGLIKAIDGYDPNREVPLSGYATPTIVGSLKRHFRDTGWAMHVPRSRQELARKVSDATDLVGQKLGRIPTSAELAEHLHVTVSDILGGIAAGQAFRLSSLDAIQARSDHDSENLASRLGATDPSYDQIDKALSLQPLLAAMPPRMRRILAMRFDDELSQSEIAAEVGLSQMQVSRLLKQALQHLRTALSEGPVVEPAIRDQVQASTTGQRQASFGAR